MPMRVNSMKCTLIASMLNNYYRVLMSAYDNDRIFSHRHYIQGTVRRVFPGNLLKRQRPVTKTRLINVLHRENSTVIVTIFRHRGADRSSAAVNLFNSLYHVCALLSYFRDRMLKALLNEGERPRHFSSCTLREITLLLKQTQDL